MEADTSFAVTAAALGEGAHRVIVDVVDGVGNETRFTQTLTIDTISPLVTIAGGATRSTTDVDPTITGSTDAAPGATVTVVVGGQTITSLVQANGSWNATPSALGPGTWSAVVSVPDPAGNVGSATQTIVVGTPGGPPVDPPGPAAVSATPLTVVGPVLPQTPVTSTTPAPSGSEVLMKTRIAPDVTMKLAGSTLAIGTKVTARADGELVVTTSGSVRISGVSHPIALTTTTGSLAAGHSATYVITTRGTSRAARATVARLEAAIRAGRKVTATVTLELVDAAGRTRIVTRLVMLT